MAFLLSFLTSSLLVAHVTSQYEPIVFTSNGPIRGAIRQSEGKSNMLQKIKRDVILITFEFLWRELDRSWFWGVSWRSLRSRTCWWIALGETTTSGGVGWRHRHCWVWGGVLPVWRKWYRLFRIQRRLSLSQRLRARLAKKNSKLHKQLSNENKFCLPLGINRAGSRLPVLVWIHGGGYFGGSSSKYPGFDLALHGDVIVVTVNYRLGAIGFLSTGTHIVTSNLTNYKY